MYTVLVCFIFCAKIILYTVATTPDYFWRDYSACDLPGDAFRCHEDIYIGQVNYRGNIPAVIYPHRGLAIAEMNGRHIVKSNIKILCSSDHSRFYWEVVNFEDLRYNQTKEAVKGGYDENINDHLFIGKAVHESQWKLGRVVPMEYDIEKGLHIWDKNGSSEKLLEFSILKYNASSSERNEWY